MDIDFWASRRRSAKHFSAVQASRLNSDNQSVADDSEGDDDAKACFPCPFCYVDIEVHLVCGRLQEEHCFDLKNAVCPLCAGNLLKDATEHFIVQHTSLLKRRKRFQKSGLWNGGSAMLGKELSSFLVTSTIGRGNAHGSASDPLLSPFICNAPLSDNEVTQEDDSSDEVSVASESKSQPARWEPTLTGEGHEEEIEERKQKAKFIQQLILSTVF